MMQSIMQNSPLFPVSLKNIDNPVKQIYYKGNIDLLYEKNILSVIGTRSPTEYGARVTREFVKELSLKGVVIVSGLAYGIDTIAHKVTLENNGKTIAVLAHGLDMVYPKSNEGLLNKIIESGGLVITEYPPEVKPKPYMFLERSRIVTGVSQGTLIVEAKERGGSISAGITAFHQNRNVYAVPGNIYSPCSKGTNILINDNLAYCINNINTLLKILGLEQTVQTTMFDTLPEDEKKVLEYLKKSSQTLDSLSYSLDMLISRVVIIISKLEIMGLIIRNSDFTYSLK